jgi:hypothetical protein
VLISPLAGNLIARVQDSAHVPISSSASSTPENSGPVAVVPLTVPK